MSNPEAKQEQAGQRRIGKGMIIGSWVGVLIILTLFFSAYLERVNNPNSSPKTFIAGSVKEITLMRNKFGHYVASGLINNREVTFLLDTGATDVALSDELATMLDLRRGAYVTSQTANGTVTARQTTLSEVSIGSIRLQNVRASILPDLPDNEVLLGMSFLKKLELVQRGNQLVIRQY